MSAFAATFVRCFAAIHQSTGPITDGDKEKAGLLSAGLRRAVIEIAIGA